LDQQITVYDNYKVLDDNVIFNKLANQLKNGSVGPVGWVKITLQTKNGIVYDEGQNLVVAQGREFVAEKIFDTISKVGSVDIVDYRSHIVSHFAVGEGGTNVSGSAVTLLGPYICDTQLLSAIDLGAGLGYLEEKGSGVDNAIKPIMASDGDLWLESQDFSGGLDTCTRYTKVKCTCIVASGEPTSLLTGESKRIDEAGLYFTVPSGTTPPITYSDPYLFAHICFAPKWKEKESTLTIEWYILC
jgi:hypothetical protein